MNDLLKHDKLSEIKKQSDICPINSYFHIGKLLCFSFVPSCTSHLAQHRFGKVHPSHFGFTFACFRSNLLGPNLIPLNISFQHQRQIVLPSHIIGLSCPQRRQIIRTFPLPPLVLLGERLPLTREQVIPQFLPLLRITFFVLL